MRFTDVVRFAVCVFSELINNRLFGTILVLGLRRKVSDSGSIKDERRGHTARELRERREGNVDPVTVEATSRTDRSRVMRLVLRIPASVLTCFVRCLSVAPGQESTRVILIEWYIIRTERFRRGTTYVFRACGDSLICPFSIAMMLPVRR